MNGFKVRLFTTGTSCLIRCSGTLDGPDATHSLQPHLLALHDSLVAEKFTAVKLDVSAVDYMNSSAIKCFMAWFLKAERAKPPMYSIEVVFDPKRTWQFVSFTTMSRIAPKVLKTSALPASPTP